VDSAMLNIVEQTHPALVKSSVAKKRNLLGGVKHT